MPLLALMAFLPQWNSLSEVLHQSRSDAFEFVRADLPKIVIVFIVALVLIRSLKIATRRVKAYSRSQAVPSRVPAQQLATLSDVVYGTGVFFVAFVAITQILDVLHINVGP